MPVPVCTPAGAEACSGGQEDSQPWSGSWKTPVHRSLSADTMQWDISQLPGLLRGYTNLSLSSPQQVALMLGSIQETPLMGPASDSGSGPYVVTPVKTALRALPAHPAVDAVSPPVMQAPVPRPSKAPASRPVATPQGVAAPTMQQPAPMPAAFPTQAAAPTSSASTPQSAASASTPQSAAVAAASVEQLSAAAEADTDDEESVKSHALYMRYWRSVRSVNCPQEIKEKYQQVKNSVAPSCLVHTHE